MAQELIYTSAARGLRPGTRGFCTVAHTQGMMPQSLQLLEALSTYKNAYATLEGRYLESPVSWSHCRGSFLGRTASVLSRVSAAAADHTNRSNKLAHHLLIQQRERPLGGPAWLCSQEGVFVQEWTGEPHVIGVPRELPQGDVPSLRAETWEQVAGDAGQAGVLASSFLANPERVTVLVFTAGMPMLELIGEALALLPPAERWNVTFNTYFTSLPAGSTCVWRCCLAGTDELREMQRLPRVQVMDLTGALAEPPAGNKLVELARTGRRAVPAAAEASGEKSETGKNGFKLMTPRREINQISLRPRQR